MWSLARSGKACGYAPPYLPGGALVLVWSPRSTSARAEPRSTASFLVLHTCFSHLLHIRFVIFTYGFTVRGEMTGAGRGLGHHWVFIDRSSRDLANSFTRRGLSPVYGVLPSSVPSASRLGLAAASLCVR